MIIFVCLTTGSILVACAALPPLVFLLPVFAYATMKTKRYVSATMDELKRLDGVTRSFVLSTLAASLHGLSPIRAFQATETQTKALTRTLTTNAETYFYWSMSTRYLGFVLDFYTATFMAVIVALAIGLRGFVSPELMAVAMIYSLNLLTNIQWTVRCFSMCEQFLTAAERLLSYARLDVESVLDEELQAQKKPRDRLSSSKCKDIEEEDNGKGTYYLRGTPWRATEGEIEIRALEYRYRLDAPLVLRGVTVTFPAHAKTGLAGRTGSGKSSLVSALSRLHDVCGGRVLIDGVDVAHVPLTQLRAAIAVIPQAPALFSGTVRFNVDPKGDRSDEAILAALGEARLLRKLKQQGHAVLDTLVEEGGSNWSTGEAQLLCLARALVLKRRICCFDEATANVDFETDAYIQETLSEADTFKNATLIVIAHRIRTILNADHIVVLQDGNLLEQGSPKSLLEATPQSNFATMVKASYLQTTKGDSSATGE